MGSGAARAGLRRHRRRRASRGVSRQFRRRGGTLRPAPDCVRRNSERRTLGDRAGRRLEPSASLLVNAAGAWADDVARACGVAPLGIAPKRRTMVQLRVGRTGPQGPAARRRFARDAFISRAKAIARSGSARTTRSRPIRATPRPRRSTSRPRSTGSKAWSTGRSSGSSAAGPASGASRPTGCRSMASIRDGRVSSGARGRAGSGSRPRPPRRRWRRRCCWARSPTRCVAHIDPAVFSPARFE